MKGLLSEIAYGVTTLFGSYLLLGKHLTPPPPAGPVGFVQAFHPCPQCGAVRAHLIHSSVCRTCQTCGHTTTPGDPQ